MRLIEGTSQLCPWVHYDKRERVQSDEQAENPLILAVFLFLGHRRILDVVVEMKLVWVGAHPNGVSLVLFLVGNPQVDEFFGEDAAFEKELVVLLELAEGFVE